MTRDRDSLTALVRCSILVSNSGKGAAVNKGFSNWQLVAARRFDCGQRDSPEFNALNDLPGFSVPLVITNGAKSGGGKFVKKFIFTKCA